MGLPRVIMTDQGKQFNNKLNRELLNIEHRLTTPYHPQVLIIIFTGHSFWIIQFHIKTGKQLRRKIKSKHADQTHWRDNRDMFFDARVFAYGTTVHESEKEVRWTTSGLVSTETIQHTTSKPPTGNMAN